MTLDFSQKIELKQRIHDVLAYMDFDDFGVDHISSQVEKVVTEFIETI